MTRAGRCGLLALLLVAAGLRLWGIGFGLPGIAHDDEWQYAQQGVSMLARGSAKVTTDDGLPYLNPTGFKLVVAAFCAPVDAWKAGGLPGGAAARDRYKQDRGSYHLAGRLASLLFGLAGVVFTFLAGRQLGGFRAGFAGAALLAVSPLHVRDSQFATNDVATATVLAAGLWLLAASKEPTPRQATWLGAVLGIGCAFKYSAGLFLGPVVVVLFLRGGTERVGLLVRALVAGALAFLVLCPVALTDTAAFVRSFVEQASYGEQPWPGQDPGHPALLHLAHLQKALGIGGLCLAAGGLALWAKRGRYELLAYPALHLLFFLPLPLFFARLDLPLLPFLCVAAGTAVGRLRLDPWGRALVLGAILFAPTHDAVRVADLMGREDTRLELRRWLTAKLDAGERPVVVVDRGVLRYLPRSKDGQEFDPRLAQVLLLPKQAPEAPLRLPPGQHLVLVSSFHHHGPVERAGAEEVLRIDPARPGAEVPYAQEERYGPWDHLWARARPGPTISAFAWP